MRIMPILLLSTLSAVACQAAVLTVDDDGATDFNTIQAALDEAKDNDTIIVQPGIYMEDLHFQGKNVLLTSVSPSDSEVIGQTIIAGNVQFSGTEDPNCVLAGFRIDGSIIGYDGSVYPQGEVHTHATICHCVLENIITGCGGVIRGCDGLISHCIIAHIGYRCRRAWPVAAIVQCDGLFENCTLVDAADGIEVREDGDFTLRNCIIYHGTPIIVRAGGTLNLSFCNLEGGLAGIFGAGTVDWETGNTDVAPCFARPGDWDAPGDYHLRSQAGRWDAVSQKWVCDDISSVCIDAGDPNSNWTGELWPHGQRCNMGAYGDTPEASMSLSLLGHAADVNHDDTLNAADLQTFANTWLNRRAALAGDIDRDGQVDFADFARLASAWRFDLSSGQEPFALVLGKNAAWLPGHEGYDPNLPGYRVMGDIASIALSAMTDRLPEKLVLVIRTHPSTQPMLENFTLIGSHVKLSGEPFNDAVGLTYFRRQDGSEQWEPVPHRDGNTYLTFEIVGRDVHVTFSRKAIELLRTECLISWIDWYRR